MVTERECKLVKFEGFNQIFEEYLSETGSKAEAYRLTEKEYKESFKTYRYSSYESFRKSRERLFKK
jgi:lipoate-protein ligase A